MSVCIHSTSKRASYFRAFFASFFVILKPFLTENEVLKSTKPVGIDVVMQIFHFSLIFPFQ